MHVCSQDDEKTKRILLERAKSPEWLGNFGEAIWSKILKCSGWKYISLAKICEGGAPMARGSNGQIILPDFDACQDGKAVFVEAKAKSRSIIFRLKNQERHGINERNYINYLEIQREFGKRCCIAVVELQREVEPHRWEWSGSILIETLANLGEPRSEVAETPHKVYWPRKQFADLHSFSPTELLDLAHGRIKHTCEDELRQILFPFKQNELFG